MTIDDQSVRTAGLRGRKPARHLPSLMLSRFRATPPAPPASADVSGGITAWGMLGNDTLGDCGPAATEHARMAKAVVGSGQFEPGFAIPTDATTEALYGDYGVAQGETPVPPATIPDEGVENASWLQWLFTEAQAAKLAGDDVDEIGFAELDLTNADEVRQALIDFRGVLIGGDLTDDANDLFNAHEPWTVANGEQPDPNDGHDMYLVGYGPAGYTLVTWGALQDAETGWFEACIDEAWVLMTREDAERAGVDFDALIAEINALGGTAVAPTPPVPPAPAPVPAPPVVPPDPVPVVPPAPAPAPVPPQPAPPAPAPVPRILEKLLDELRRIVLSPRSFLTVGERQRLAHLIEEITASIEAPSDETPRDAPTTLGRLERLLKDLAGEAEKIASELTPAEKAELVTILERLAETVAGALLAAKGPEATS